MALLSDENHAGTPKQNNYKKHDKPGYLSTVLIVGNVYRHKPVKIENTHFFCDKAARRSEDHNQPV